MSSVEERMALYRLDRAAYRLACDVADDGNVWTATGEWPTREALVAEFREARSAWLATGDESAEVLHS